MEFNFIFILEILGILSFAVSGSILAMEKECDLFGVIVLGCITSIGGGLIRDVILGIHPPMAFQDPIYAIVSIITSLLTFILFYKNQTFVQKYIKKLDYVNLLFDSIGLGIFVVVGINTAIQYGSTNTFLILFTGLITGVGGGILRDMMATQIPMVLHKRIYAVAALIGGTTYYILYLLIPDNIAIIIGTLTTIIIRLLAAYYKWNLPKVKFHQ
ncbi:MAG: trimeric intracellular cation channel family protein [Erysipelotrichaceae bacterium]|nr:trimeric intracellular cation channel family protein [Erysipelotrichaceae bacterium]